MKRTVLLIVLILTVLISCSIIETNGFYTGYNKLTETEKKEIVFVKPDSTICSLQQSLKVYAINGLQLRNCLEKNDTSLIYFWGPNCSSNDCILISACQDYCNARNYKLYVVADYYDVKQMNAQNESNFPLLIANHIYYHKDYANKLNKLFLKDLLGSNTISKEDKYKRFLMFKANKLIDIREKLF